MEEKVQALADLEATARMELLLSVRSNLKRELQILDETSSGLACAKLSETIDALERDIVA